MRSGALGSALTSHRLCWSSLWWAACCRACFHLHHIDLHETLELVALLLSTVRPRRHHYITSTELNTKPVPVSQTLHMSVHFIARCPFLIDLNKRGWVDQEASAQHRCLQDCREEISRPSATAVEQNYCLLETHHQWFHRECGIRSIHSKKKINHTLPHSNYYNDFWNVCYISHSV